MLKKILNWIVFLFTGKGEIANEAVDEGLIDYSGQDEVIPTTKPRRVRRRLDDLTGQRFGLYNVLELDHTERVGSGTSTLSYYKCKCSVCGKIFVRSRSNLLVTKGVRHIGKCR